MQETVEGLAIPVRLAGNPGLEICNTLAGWGEHAPKEYLVSYEHLLVWARETRLVDAGSVVPLRRQATIRPAAAVRVLGDARRFRGSYYRLLRHESDQQDAEEISRVVEAAGRCLRFTVDAAGSGWALDPDRSGLRLPLHAAGLAAADQLSGAHGAVRACPGRGCGWVFADPAGRRRWCSMSVCGNRAKARQYARLHTAAR